MNDRIEIERFAFADHRVELYPYPLKGFSVRYIPGLDELKPGTWLDLLYVFCVLNHAFMSNLVAQTASSTAKP
jgi:hypothetical protein